MDRAIFKGREFLLLSLALNHSLSTLFKRGYPGIDRAEIVMLQKKVHELGVAASKAGRSEETFTLRDEESEPDNSWKIPAVES